MIDTLSIAEMHVLVMITQRGEEFWDTPRYHQHEGDGDDKSVMVTYPLLNRNNQPETPYIVEVDSFSC